MTENLWAYVFCMAKNLMNETPIFQNPDKKSPQAVFSGSQMDPNSKHWKTFGFPVYILDSALQATHPYHKWSERSRVGV